MRLFRAMLPLALALFAATPALADFVSKDAPGTGTLSFGSVVNGNVHTQKQVPSDATGTPYGSGNPMPVTVPGVATAAKQPALGVAGTPSPDVLSMQGVNGGTPVPVSGPTLTSIDGKVPAKGQATKANSTPVTMASDQDSLVVSGQTVIATASIQRPADTTAYAVGDILCASTTAGSCAPFALQVCTKAGGTGMIREFRLKVSGVAAAGMVVRLHPYRDLPTPTNGDNGAWLTTESNALGSADVTLSETYSDAVKGYGIRAVGSEWNYDCASGSQVIYVYPEIRSAFTPGSASTWTLAAEALPN